jgi:hypothetical protein
MPVAMPVAMPMARLPPTLPRIHEATYHRSVIATIRGETRSWLRSAWRRYRSVPRPIRWPLTLVALLFLTVIVANLTFGAAQRTSSTTLLVPAGQTVGTTVQIDAGRLAGVEWSVAGADRSANPSAGGPLTAQLSGPSSDLPLQERALAGRFDFKNGFTRSSYQIQFRNDASAIDTAADPLRVDVTWIIR